MAEIFLSYASQDRNDIKPIADALGNAGWSVWWDQDIEAGHDWDQTIERELAACGVVVALFTNASVDSRWVRAEAMFGLQHNKLIPVVIDDVALPIILQTVQAVMWRGNCDPILTAVKQKLNSTDAAEERIQPGQQISTGAKRSKQFLPIAMFAIFVLASLSIYWMTDIQETTEPPDLDAEATQLYEHALQSGAGRLEELEAIVAKYPNYAPAWASLVPAYFGLDLPYKELVALQKKAARRAVTLDPHLPQAQIEMARITTHGPEKIAYLEEALRLDPKSITALTHAAYYYGSDGQAEKSVEYYERALAADPNNAGAHRAYARMLGAFGNRFEQALAHHELATQIDGDMGYQGAYYRFQNDLFGLVKSDFELFLTDMHYLNARNVANALRDVDESLAATYRWVEITRNLSSENQTSTQLLLNIQSRSTDLDGAMRTIEKYHSENPEGSELDDYIYQMERSAIIYKKGDITEFNNIRLGERDKLIETLEPYRLLDGYRIANITEIHFSEAIYLRLMLLAWSLGEQSLVDNLAETLGKHWSVVRISSVGPGTKYYTLAWIAAIKGDFSQALIKLEQAYRAGYGPRAFVWDARQFDMQGSLSPLLSDSRFIDLLARSKKHRASELEKLKKELPIVLNPDLEIMREMSEALKFKRAGERVPAKQ